MKYFKKSKGFTLVEWLVVLIIIVVLAIIVSRFRSPSSSGKSNYGNVTRSQKRLVNETYDALSLTIESNLKFREISISCSEPLTSVGGVSIGTQKLVTKLIVIPLNESIIESTINYKAALESLDDSVKEKLLKEAYKEFINSNRNVFILIVSNKAKLDAAKHSIYFDEIDKNLKIRINEKEYKLSSYTPNFLSHLNPGWNQGYIEFENFRKDYKGSLNTYSMSFDKFNMVCEETKEVENWAFLFDESTIDYLALIEQGLSKKDIKNRYFVNSYESIGFDETDVGNLVKFTSTALSTHPALKLIK